MNFMYYPCTPLEFCIAEGTEGILDKVCDLCLENQPQRHRNRDEDRYLDHFHAAAIHPQPFSYPLRSIFHFISFLVVCFSFSREHLLCLREAKLHLHHRGRCGHDDQGDQEDAQRETHLALCHSDSGKRDLLAGSPKRLTLLLQLLPQGAAFTLIFFQNPCHAV